MTEERDRRTWAAPAALVAFAAVGAAVALQRTRGFDAWAAGAVRRLESPLADAVMAAATALASGPTTFLVAAVVAAAALRAGARRTAALVAIAWGASALLTATLKALSGRARPSFAYTTTVLSSFAFPSGHALNSVVVFGMVAVVAARRFPGARRALLGAALALAILAGVSRVYLGVHYPTDVLGGWAAGAALLALLVAALPPEGLTAPRSAARAPPRGERSPS